MEPNILRMEISARPDNVAFARVAVAAFVSQLDFTLNELDEIKVAVSEAVSNSIIHGYQNQGTGKIEIVVSVEGLNMEISIADFGKGIEDLDAALQPAFSTEPDRMGLGFVFMQSFMDEFLVETAPHQGTKVILRKRLGSLEEHRAVQ